MAGEHRQLDVLETLRVRHNVLHQRVVVLSYLIRLGASAFRCRIETNNDRGIAQDVRWHAVGELIIDDEHIDAAFLNRSRELLLGRADVEQINGSAGVALRRRGGDNAAAVARHDAQTDFIKSK